MILISARGRPKKRVERGTVTEVMSERRDRITTKPTLLSLKMGKEVTTHRKWAASRSQGRKGPQERQAALPTPGSELRKPRVGSVIYRTVR